MVETFFVICFVIAFIIFLLIPGSGLLLIALFAGCKSKADRTGTADRMHATNESLARMEARIKNIETIMSDRY
jgi:hypothetical protein